MKAETIAVGSELLLGQIANTNAQIISKELQKIGIDVFFHTCVGDNEQRILGVLETAFQRSDVIIFTGGLGPTRDDLTKETVSSFLKLPLVTDEASLENIRRFFEMRGSAITPNNFKQALIPQGSHAVPNNNGTAPGVFVEHQGRIIVMLPGPPFEMEPMFHETVIPQLAKASNNVIFSKVMRFYGLGESSLEVQIQDLLEQQTNPTIAPLAKMGEVTLRLTAKAKSRSEALELIAPVEQKIMDKIGSYLYGYDDETPESIVAGLLSRQKKTISIAESCTGGLMTHMLTNVPGISQYLERGIVSYSNRSKMDLLGVDEAVLNRFGAVSSETAEQMAKGIRANSGTDIGVSITGIAGPGGGTKAKPVGLVYIGYSCDDYTHTEEHRFWGTRQTIKARSANSALHLVRKNLMMREV